MTPKYNSFTADAILNIEPTAVFTVFPDSIDWSTTPSGKIPSESAIIAEQNRLIAVWESNEYQRKRARAYPPMAQQLDMQYHDSVNGTTTWLDAINAVKALYPKP